MKKSFIKILALFSLFSLPFFVGGCSKKPEEPKAQTSSQSSYEKQAEKEITAENAEDELNKLEKEINADNN